jgi:hypothetical protein
MIVTPHAPKVVARITQFARARAEINVPPCTSSGADRFYNRGDDAGGRLYEHPAPRHGDWHMGAAKERDPREHSINNLLPNTRQQQILNGAKPTKNHRERTPASTC